MLKLRNTILVLILLLLSGCAFVNTLYNGGAAFRKAQRAERLGAKMSKDSASVAQQTKPLYKRAIDKSDKTLLEYPKSERSHDNAYFLKGISLFALGEYSPAINVFEVLLEYYPESKYIPRALLYLAKSFAATEDYLIADDYLNQLLERYPEMEHNQDVVMLRADLAVELEGKTAAIAALEQRLAETTDPRYKLVIIERLMGLNMENGDYEKAISYTEKMPAFDKKFSQIYYKIEFRKLQALRITYRRDEAIALADAMLKNSSYLYNRSEIMLEKGITLVDMGRYDDAIKVFEDIIALQSDTRIRGKAWFEYAGVSIDFKGNLYSGKVQLDSALALAGNDKDFIERIKKRLDGLNKIAALQAELDSADVFSKIDSAYYRYRIGEEYWLSASLPDSAMIYFEKVIESPQTQDSIRAKALYSIAYILMEMKKDTVTAENIFYEIIEKYPHFEAAKSAQEMLGIPVTIMTRRDSANVQFEIAEKLFFENNEEYSQEAYYAYLLVAMKFPDIKDIAAKALFAAGMLVNKRNATPDEVVDTAVVKIFVRLCNEYPESEQCKAATAMMNIGEVQSYATEYTARNEVADSLQAVQDSITASEIPEEKRAILPDFQGWI